MTIGYTRELLSRVFYQRCFWLFAALAALVGAVSFVPSTDGGRLTVNGINIFVLVATVAAVGRTTLSFTIALLLALPAFWFQYSGLLHDDDREVATSWMLSGGLYFITTVYLLRYVFQPTVITQDKLFGAAAAYLMIGVLWAYFYATFAFFSPES